STFRLPPVDVMAIALSVGLGFLSHLILDELYSMVNFEGILIAPKNSLGSALKFSGQSRPATVTAYLAIAVLVYLNYRESTGLFRGLEILLK
ncbi:MAG: hypothetical protein OEV64_13755, partial [Desulfobulbaceae bacterium]|nr:hypothetical protein [Desulfobulbaceae bacterium]